MSETKRLLIATGSKHKLEELRDLLDLPNTELVSLLDEGIKDGAEETGLTFEQNARIKAQYYWWESGLATLADDSGIEVDALDGRPGVHTRRYAGENATDEENNTQRTQEARTYDSHPLCCCCCCMLVAQSALPPPSAASAFPSSRGALPTPPT